MEWPRIVNNFTLLPYITGGRSAMHLAYIDTESAQCGAQWDNQ